MLFNLTDIDDEISSVTVKRPHVVVLGAGASRAACPNGDKNGKQLPLMADLVDVLDLTHTIKKWGINPRKNFEKIFSELDEENELEKLKIIEQSVKKYFAQLQLPNIPTLYDHLVLSLTKKDLIATFNWDPLLLQAWIRNQRSGLTMPKLVFLHGNSGLGYCNKDKRYGLRQQHCPVCQKPYEPMPLLYPIKKKDYASNILLEDFWGLFKHKVKQAHMTTIFGYSAPKTDKEAIKAMKEAFKTNPTYEFAETVFITPQSQENVYVNWKSFIHSHHYEIYEDFYKSFLANHPRRTGYAWWAQFMEAKFITANPIPSSLDFSELWKWFERFKKAEDSIEP